MWVDNLPGNLELLTLLSVSSVSVSNVAVAPPVAYDVVVVPDDVPKSETARYRREFNQARRERSVGMSASSTRGGKRKGVGREDILIAIEGSSDLDNLFILGFTGLMVSGSTDEFARVVYAKGIEDGNSFTAVTMDDFSPVFAAAFRDLLNPCRNGKPDAGIGTRNGLARTMGCSTSKAGRLLECYDDVAHILMQSAQRVSNKLHCGLRRVA